MVVLQQGEHSSVNNSRPAGKEDRYKKKGRERDREARQRQGSEGAVQKRTFNYFPRPTKDLDLFM